MKTQKKARYFSSIPFCKWLRATFTWFLLFLSLFSSALDETTGFKKASQGMDKKIQKLIKQSQIPSYQLGIIVATPTQNIYELNGEKDFIPASLIKIGVAGALLELLSPSLKWTTLFLSQHKIKNQVLNGPLYLKGGGDPGFVSESLWNLVNNLKRTGLKTVTHDLIVDASRFDFEAKGPRLFNPSHSSYDAPVSALSFNWNTVNIYLRPGEKRGQPLRLHLDPSPLYFHSVKNQTRTADTKVLTDLLVKRKKAGYNRESLEIKGRMPLGAKETLIYKNILDPVEWTGWNAIAFLKQRGIEVQGKVRRGLTPVKAQVLAEWKSRTLADQVKLMMKYSNNFMVEMLLKNMVVELKNQKGTLREGIKIIKTYLNQVGIPEKEYTLVQPSGLSRKNKIKPRHLMTFLKYWLTQDRQPEFESAFPLANEDGTLKRYFKNKLLKGSIRAKTGSLNGVTGLAGYMRTKNKAKKMFVFIFNGPPSAQKKANQLFEKILLLIFNEKMGKS